MLQPLLNNYLFKTIDFFAMLICFSQNFVNKENGVIEQFKNSFLKST